MELLDNKSFLEIITRHWASHVSVRRTFSLYSDPQLELKKTLTEIVNGNHNVSYYYLSALFKNTRMTSATAVIDVIIHLLMERLDRLRNESDYFHIFRHYNDYCRQLFEIIKTYDTSIIERYNINVQQKCNVYSIIKTCTLYNHFIAKSNILTSVARQFNVVNDSNLDNLIEFLNTLHSLFLMKQFIVVRRKELDNLGESLIDKIETVDLICKKIHETLTTSDLEKAKRYINILSCYSKRRYLTPCYLKYLQVRLLTPGYQHVDVEKDFINKISNVLDDHAPLLLAIINDVDSNRIDKSTPFILTKNLWDINSYDLQVVYPVELQQQLDIIEKTYHAITPDVCIKWQPTLGNAQFTTVLNGKLITITCNTLQAILLTHLNHYHTTTITQFCRYTTINEKLASLIFDSVTASGIIVMSNGSYTVNEGYDGLEQIVLHLEKIEK